MKTIKVLFAEGQKELSKFITYRVSKFFRALNYIFLFTGLIIGTKTYLQSPVEKEIYVMGLIAWWLVSYSIQSVSSIIQDESRTGTLEQLFLTKTDIVSIMVMRILVGYIIELIQVGIIYVLLSYLFSIPLIGMVIPLTNKIILLLILFVGLSGIGFLVSAASIIFKKADAVARATSNLILFFSGLIIPIEHIPTIFAKISNVFPFYWFIDILRQQFIYYNYKASVSSLISFSAISIFWFILGVCIFKASINIAKNKGTLSHY